MDYAIWNFLVCESRKNIENNEIKISKFKKIVYVMYNKSQFNFMLKH